MCGFSSILFYSSHLIHKDEKEGKESEKETTFLVSTLILSRRTSLYVTAERSLVASFSLPAGQVL